MQLESLYLAATRPNIAFSEEEQYSAIVNEAKELKATITSMLKEEKVSLPAMREVIAKIELVPVNFEKEVDLFQQKMLSAQNWLAKARKCIPKRRVSRRGGGSEPKKMDLDAIRALVDDAPCDDSAEMFEMQDLLECADEWAEKVKQAIEGGAEIQLDELKELFEEGNDMPVEMEEQKYLEAEIAAREWCVKAASMLAARKSLKDLERVVEDAKSIRTRIHPKKQSRWKPQVERDIHAAIDTARRWVNEVRDVVGQSAFDKLISGSSSSSSDHASHSSSRADSSNHGNLKAKKPLESIARLLEKSERLVVNVSSYIDAVKELQANGYQLQDEVRALLIAVRCRPPADKDESPPAEAVATDGDEPMPMAASEQDEKQKEPRGTAVDSTAEPVELGDFLQASALLDRVYALPFHFEEGLELEQVIVAERDWSQRVKDALPPRQSRKKRQSKNQITLEQLEQLLAESKELHFRFPEEMRTLERELEELTTWQVKARDAVEAPIAERIAELMPKLKDYDLRVYEKLQAAKKKLAETHPEDGVENGAAAAATDSSNEQSVKHECDHVLDGAIDVNMAGESLKQESSTAIESGGTIDMTVSTESNSTTKTDPSLNVKTAEVLLPIDAEAIMSHLRIESGCMQKQKKSEDDDKKVSSTGGDEKEKLSLLEPVLAMAEKGLEEISELEFRDERINALETIELSGDAESSAFTDEAVKVLEAWRDQIAQVVEEGELLSAVAPELQSLSTVVDLLTWLQNARSLFYDEMLPLRELVTSGNAIARDLKEIKSVTAMGMSTMDTLELMLWPLPHLEAQDQIVQSWTERVSNCISEKRVKVKTLQSLMDEGGALLMEADAFKIILDEVKKAKSWLSKLKKRLKALITKRVGRLSINTARSFVEEGEDIVIEIPVFDLLKENVEMASEWEARVLESGLETGTARIASLVSLLNEYDCAGLVIDMDMHREVLKSATERYCICRQPFDGLMIGCDFCDDWFHDNCIGMSKEKAEKVENYTCPSCTILQDLSTAMQQVIDDQKNLWSQSEYVKSYEKQHGVLTRKLKREEKAVEKGEMLLLSCTNQMNQLKAGIEEIEKAKSKLTVNHQVNAESSSSTLAPAVQESTLPAQPAPAPAVAPVETPNQSLQTIQQPVVSANLSAPSQESGGIVSAAAVPPPPTEATPESATAAPPVGAPVIPTVPAMPITAAPPQSGTPTAPAAPTSAAPTQNGTPVNIAGTFASLQSVGFSHLYPSILLPPGRYGSVLHPPISVLPLSSAPSTDPAKQLANGSAITTKPIAAKGIESKQSTPTKNIAPSVNRLAALVAAGDIEHQLPKLRTEHAELMVQVHDAQESLRLSKDRLELAQVGLRDLRNTHIARELGLPVALAWVRKAVVALNTMALLSRSKLLDGGLVPAEYESIISELTQSDKQWTAHIDTIFPEVRTYVRLLRLVGWSLVVVALLQERPSRESLSNAIAYAVEHNLWESKTVSPLKGVLGRMDAWISKVHKSMLKPASKMQKLPRLKLFMNEYSKLPLTCGLAETLEEFVKVLEMDVPTGEQTIEQLKEAQDAAEAAVVTTFAEATAALSASHAAASAPSSAQPKPPRKRKPYTRKERQPGAGGSSAKKNKKNPSSVEGESVSNGIADLTAAAAAVDPGTVNEG